MHTCDALICVGARFDDRITGRVDAFSPKSTKVHIDIDPSSINKNVRVDIPIIGDVGAVMGQLIKAVKVRKKKQKNAKLIRKWWKQIETWQGVKCLAYKNDKKVIKPQFAIERLYELTKNQDTFITTEVGQHQMWAAQFYKFDKPLRWMTSGGLGTMGYGLPSAVGVQVAHPKKLVIDISGEASFMMNMQEIATAIQHRLPIKVFILNNQYMGMVRQWQELLHESRYSQTYMDSLPDFVKLAESFGALGLRTDNPAHLDDLIIKMIQSDKPVIADIGVDPKENCFPMIPSGSAHNEMILGSEAQSFGKDKISADGMVLV